MTLKIGITGGIGAGKSTVCQIFKALNIPIYDADSRAKWLMIHHTPLVEAIKNNFGENAYLPDGQLNRTFLAQTVFNKHNRLAELNALVHPCVAEDSLAWFQSHQDKPYVIKEAALLYESGSYKDLDKIIVVYTPLELRVQRVLQRDKQRSEQEVRAIIQNQMSDEDKIAKADFIVYNDHQQMIIPQVVTLHQHFVKLHKDIEK